MLVSIILALSGALAPCASRLPNTSDTLTCSLGSDSVYIYRLGPSGDRFGFDRFHGGLVYLGEIFGGDLEVMDILSREDWEAEAREGSQP